ncbi:hypothetical protein PUR59_15365 [Streptomyces sp. SP18ES09]|uniref:hypothetical protein n=1 Tax=Streptomyces sp. SP18ES09 TaxID=3002532 RepID=UPI002E790F66|nr:hypothetical protein [Streptomyces sp. SP18ES09]MEE1816387.1 hypothetical protein [Streptomyces sp. SP18ES09]
MKITRIGLTACGVAALLAGAVACTDGGAGPAEPTAKATAAPCANGTYTWFNVDRRDVLTGVAAKQKLGKGGGTLTNRIAPLHTPLTAVTFVKGPQADVKATLLSLGARFKDSDAALGDAYDFADVHRALPKNEPNSTVVQGAGEIVEYTWVREMTGDFRYTCGDAEPTTGRAIGWDTDGAGILECSTTVPKAGERQPVLEAARMACGPDSPAAKPGKA